ncbi:hypothetical protein HPB47_013707 [Ixodes persulcatus]|uniref:Uncharacterized protein n=1 Tax=Ixodes persulcatus TaxID=34615 RepID=A0AC60QXT9_IXOPE|nr:hypothetical protein HPB47_013707 [Ixodes persulcatus]
MPATIRQGDLVLLDAHTLSNAAKGITAKLAPRRTGHFRVVHWLGGNDFVLKDPVTGRNQHVAHADQLTPYHEPVPDLLPPGPWFTSQEGKTCEERLAKDYARRTCPVETKMAARGRIRDGKDDDDRPGGRAVSEQDETPTPAGAGSFPAPMARRCHPVAMGGLA